MNAGYSSFGIAINRKHAFKWLFHQEKVTLHCTQKVYVNSETALALGTFEGPILAREALFRTCADRGISDCLSPPHVERDRSLRATSSFESLAERT